MAKKQPGELAGSALEQMGIGGPPATGGQQTPQVSDEAKKLAKMKAAERVRSEQLAAKVIQELDAEIEKRRRTREEQLKARRRTPEQQEEEKKQEAPPLVEPSTKPRRGLFGLPAGRHSFWGRRIKSAQQQAQPEMAGRRVGE